MAGDAGFSIELWFRRHPLSCLKGGAAITTRLPAVYTKSWVPSPIYSLVSSLLIRIYFMFEGNGAWPFNNSFVQFNKDCCRLESWGFLFQSWVYISWGKDENLSSVPFFHFYLFLIPCTRSYFYHDSFLFQWKNNSTNELYLLIVEICPGPVYSKWTYLN